MGLTSTKEENNLVLSITFPLLEDTQPLRAALETFPDLAGGISGRKLILGPTVLILQWRYAFKKPNSSEVVALVNRIMPPVSMLTKPWAHCSKCGSRVGEVVLWEEIPNYHCAACQDSFMIDVNRKSQDYEQRPVTLKRACLTAGVGGLSLAIIGGIVLNYYSAGNQGVPPRIAILTAAIIAGVVGHLFERNIGRIEVWKQGAVAACIALGCTFIAELINATLITMQQFEMKFSSYLVFWSAKSLISARLTPGIDIVVTMMQLITGAIPGWFLKRSRPRFKTPYTRVPEASKVPTLAAR